MDKVIYFTEQIFKEGNTYSSYCPELDIASCGNTIEEARKNLYETIEIVFEECRKKGTLKAFLEEMGYSVNGRLNLAT